MSLAAAGELLDEIRTRAGFAIDERRRRPVAVPKAVHMVHGAQLSLGGLPVRPARRREARRAGAEADAGLWALVEVGVVAGGPVNV